MNIARQVRRIEPRVAASPWPGHEWVRGYAVMVLPFTSGALLGLRVWPQNDFAPYKSVWYADADAVGAASPRWTWRFRGPIRFREWMAERILDLGALRFRFLTASEHETVIMPGQVYRIKQTEARWEGRDLGEPVRLAENPAIGGVPLPIRPAFVVGEAHMKIRDPLEYSRTRERVAAREAA